MLLLSRFCLVELDILLFAIEVCEENGQRRLAINPDRTSKYYRIAKRTRGFFLAGSSEEASRLVFMKSKEINSMIILSI
jgi:hypothetical protein